MKQRLQKTICYILLFTGLGFLYYKWYQGTGFAVPCFFHAITKLYCPGCGMTRCLTHLLQFEIQDAFRCNVAIFLLSPALLYYLFPLFLCPLWEGAFFQSTEHPAFWLSYHSDTLWNCSQSPGVFFFTTCLRLKIFSYCPAK